jgi:hypothetical protein
MKNLFTALIKIHKRSKDSSTYMTSEYRLTSKEKYSLVIATTIILVPTLVASLLLLI